MESPLTTFSTPLESLDVPRRIAVPTLVKLFFLADAVVVLLAIVARALEPTLGSEIVNFFRLSYESNLPTAYSGFQHAMVGVLFGLLAVREIRTDVRRWAIALPALMFLFFGLDEIAMIHERLSHVIADHVHSLKASGEYTSMPAMVFCLPAVLIVVAIAARLTRRYWQGRPRVACLFVTGMTVFLFAAVGLEAIGGVVVSYHGLYSLETLLEESGEMLGVTIVLWSALELLAAERFTMAFSKGGLRFS
jgi:hypothetical protein